MEKKHRISDADLSDITEKEFLAAIEKFYKLGLIDITDDGEIILKEETKIALMELMESENKNPS